MDKIRFKKITLAYILFALLTVIFVYLGIEIKENELQKFDSVLQTAIRSGQSSVMDKIMLTITNSSSFFPVAALFIFLTAYLYKRNLMDKFYFVLITLPGTFIINYILKLIYRRGRPDFVNLLIKETSFSFPSGHAMMSSAIVLTIMVLLWNNKNFKLFLLLGFIYSLLVGYSRVYLGVHYPSDILGGWIISIAWVTLSQRIILKKHVVE